MQSEHEQLNYARQLKERLEAFTQDFLPHMKEEEEVINPSLDCYTGDCDTGDSNTGDCDTVDCYTILLDCYTVDFYTGDC